ncbi:MAG TPA: tRNA-uridine aminocarboxypropyltransferase [Polyangiaceae bacterium]|nr:tRNA-uridine aminocarboxypropyltransferase [Polyangiaceae bacterium]
MAVSYGRDTCYRCFRPLGSCLCDAIPAIDNRIPVLILQHARERTHPFNTARLVALGLRRSELLVDYAGCLRRNPALLGSLEGCGVLYPHASARDVSAVPAGERPRKLIVIDGTWHNARTLYRDLPALHALPHFTLPPGSSSAFVLRRQPAAYCLSTLEATVYALQALEPETPGISALLETFARMQGRQLALIDAQRGELPEGHSGRYRKRQRSRESRAVPRALLESYDSLVLAYAESCFDERVPGGRGVLCCAALRPSTGERFFRVIAHPELAPEHLAYLGLGASLLRDAVSSEQFRSDWEQFLRPGELLASWNTSTLGLLARTLGAAPGGIALKSAYYNLKRFRGSLEQILQREGLPEPSPSPVRALRRLEQARQLAELTRRHAGA